MDNAITDLLDAVIPELSALIGDIRLWLNLAMLIGPVLLALYGAYLYFLAPPEANHKMGYRTHYGMGSVAAWKYTQGLAGKVWGFLGAGLLVLAVVGCVLVGTQEPDTGVLSALVILALEAISALVGYAVIELTVSGRFDADGNPKK